MDINKKSLCRYIHTGIRAQIESEAEAKLKKTTVKTDIRWTERDGYGSILGS